MATQNLGNVRALIVSATAPTNTNLIWRDTSTSPHTTRLYNTSTSTWIAISMTGGTSDPDAIHDNVAGEIAAITEKTSPVDADLLLIEDSEDSNNKKRVEVGNLATGGASERVNSTQALANGATYTVDFSQAQIVTLTIANGNTTGTLAVSNLTTTERYNTVVIDSSANASGLTITFNDQSGTIDYRGPVNDFPGTYPNMNVAANAIWEINFENRSTSVVTVNFEEVEVYEV